ncbi:unnamed protein product, partial [Owenia fusiformis]
RDFGKMPTKKDLGDMSWDDFMKEGIDGSDASDDEQEETSAKVTKKDQTKKKNTSKVASVEKTEKRKKETKTKTNSPIDEKKSQANSKEKNISKSEKDVKQSNKSSTDKKGDKPITSGKKHKEQLEKLKERDPDFYEFLRNEDNALLKFDVSDSEEEDDEGIDEESSSEEEDEDGEGRMHQLPDKLEVASDASDTDDDDDEEDDEKVEAIDKPEKLIKVNMKLINQWSKGLQANSLAVIHDVVLAFKAAVHQAGSDDTVVTKYRVDDSSVFNGIIRLCVSDLLPTWLRILNLPKQEKNAKKPVLPTRSNKWGKIRKDVKVYLMDLIQLVSELSVTEMINVILRHISKLVTFYNNFPKLSKSLLKRLIKMWSTAEESTRVLAFLSINRIVRLRQDTLLEPMLKQMYMSYVKNCKFTSPTILPLINFMQRSLVEMFSLNFKVAYEYAFVYIRQLAIHLRNAIMVKKKESIQAVYNWQFIHSVGLWVRLLGATHPNDTLQPLIFPLTQTILGTIKLVPTARYYPLRFHCIKYLNQLSERTGVFIPVLPHILEVFEMTNFNKRHSSISIKPYNFACLLKLSKSQLNQKVFGDGVIDQLYELLMDQLNVHAHTIGFPEYAFPAALQLKEFVKKCKVANYTRQIKQILEKINETVKVITERRRKASINIRDLRAMDDWSIKSKIEGTPISKYFATWRKLRDRELQHNISGKERLEDTELPTIIRDRGPKKADDEDRKEFAALFDSDSEEEDDEERFLMKHERAKKKKHDSDDDYSDFDEDDLEKLAGSGDDDSDLENEDSEDEASENEDSDIEDSEDEDSEMEDETNSKTIQKGNKKQSTQSSNYKNQKNKHKKEMDSQKTNQTKKRKQQGKVGKNTKKQKTDLNKYENAGGDDIVKDFAWSDSD